MNDPALKKGQKSHDIPKAQQKLVMNRFMKVNKNPERLLDWDEAKQRWATQKKKLQNLIR